MSNKGVFEVNFKFENMDEVAVDIRKRLEDEQKRVVADTASLIYQHIVDKAENELKERKDKYLSNLELTPLNEFTWVIALDSKALWIEDGITPGTQMLPWFLNSPKAKTAKDGSRYMNVPLEKAGFDTNSPKGNVLKELVTKEMRKRGISVDQIETDGQGKPKIGTLHRFDIALGPRSKHTNIPLLQGVNVTQRAVTDTLGKSSVKRNIMTFRRASSKQDPSQYWVHPGTKGAKFFEEAEQWIMNSWDQIMRTISPQGNPTVEFAHTYDINMD